MGKEVVRQRRGWQQRQSDGDPFGTVGHVDKSHAFDKPAVDKVRDLDPPRPALTSLLGRNQQSAWCDLGGRNNGRIRIFFVGIAVFDGQQRDISDRLQSFERVVQVAQRHGKLMAWDIAIESAQIAAGPNGAVGRNGPTHLAIATRDKIFPSERSANEHKLLLASHIELGTIQRRLDRSFLIRIGSATFGGRGFRRLHRDRIDAHRW
ncbi:MAG: hypothetical protein ACK5AC_09265 [Planctomycetota bacterium]